MGAYERLYSLRILHDYFDGAVCRAVWCQPTASGAELMRRRGWLFKQTADNEWTILYDPSGAGPEIGADRLAFGLRLTTPDFVLYTHWPAFRPDAAYRLNLPSGGGVLEAAEAIVSSEERRPIGSGFCDATLALTEEMIRAARAGAPPCCTLRFHAPAYRWEYLFLPEHDTALDGETLYLEAVDGKNPYRFTAFEQVLAFDRAAYRTISEEAIPLKERYGFRLRLSSSTGANRPKRTILRDVPPPIPGRHRSAGPEFIRQVCCL